MNAILQAGRPGIVGTWTLGEVLIAAIVVIAIIAVFVVFLKNSGVAVPPWLATVAWIIGLAFVCVVAIRFLMTM